MIDGVRIGGLIRQCRDSEWLLEIHGKLYKETANELLYAVEMGQLKKHEVEEPAEGGADDAEE